MGKQFDVSVKLTGDSKGAVAAAQKTEGAFRKLTSFLSSRFVITLGDVARAASAAMSTLRESLDLSAQTNVLKRQLASAGLGFDEFISQAKAASNQTLSTADIISQATRAKLLGVGFQDMIKLMGIARVSAAAMGDEVSKSFEDITVGLARQSKQILDNQAFTISLSKAYIDLARDLDKNVEQLTESERKQALLNQVMQQGEERVKEFGDDVGGLREQLQQAEAKAADLTSAITGLFEAFATGATAGATGGQAIDDVTQKLEAQKGTMAAWGATLAVWAQEVLKTGDINAAFVKTLYQIPKIAEESEQPLTAAAAAEAALAEQAANAKDGLDGVGGAADTAAGHFKTAEEAALGLGTALGEVTSIELAVQIEKIREALAESTAEMDKNGAEYIRLEAIAAEKIQSLQERIVNLRDGLGDLKQATKESGDEWAGYASNVDLASAATQRFTASAAAAAAIPPPAAPGGTVTGGNAPAGASGSRLSGTSMPITIGGGTFSGGGTGGGVSPELYLIGVRSSPGAPYGVYADGRIRGGGFLTA